MEKDFIESDFEKEKIDDSTYDELRVLGDELKILNEETKISNTKDDIQPPQNHSAEEVKVDLLSETVTSTMVELYSITLGNICCAIAKDTSTSAYTLPTSSKKVLSEELSVFFKNSVKTKINPNVILILTFIVVTAPAVVSAFTNRKENVKSKSTQTEKKYSPVNEEISFDSLEIPKKRGRRKRVPAL